MEQPLRLDAACLAALLGSLSAIDLTRGAASYITSAAETIPVIQPLLADLFPGPWHNAGLVVLQPSQQLVGHRDRGCRGTRFHIPLIVNDGCWVFHEGTWQQLTVGQVYQMDPTAVHGAVNWGSTTRVHLLIDT